MRRQGIVLTLVFLLVILGLSGCGRPRGAGEEAQAEGVPVMVTEVRKGTVVLVQKVSGKVAPSQEVNVVPKAGGKVATVAVEVGDHVKQGQVLVQLETRELVAAVQQAEAALQLAESSLEQAQANYQDALADYERMQMLYEQGAISKQQYEKAKLGLDVARTTYEQTSTAQVQQARAALEIARSQLGNATITAPVRGTVAARMVDPGEMASPGMPVVTIVDLDPVLVKAVVSERVVNKLDVGQVVTVRVLSATEEEIPARITRIDPASDPLAGGFPIELEMENPKGIFKPGMLAELEVVTDESRDVLVMDARAVLRENGEASVFVVKDNKAWKHRVQLGLADSKSVEVIDGVQEGDQVVVVGHHYLVDGARVNIRNGGGGR